MYPSLKEVIDLAGSGQYRRIPVCREIYSDFLTPVEAMRILKNASHHCFMLESAEDSKRWGRYTFLGYDPTAEITCAEGNLRVRYGEHVVEKKGDPQQEIRRILLENRGPRLENMPPFTGGLVGFFSYEYIRYMEPGLNISCKDQDFQDVDLMLFDQVIAFDNFRQKLVMIAGVRAENPEKSYKEAEEKLKTLELLLRTGHKADPQPIHLKNPCSPYFSEAEYCGMVEKAKHYIREGDIFQVVLSNPLEAEAEGSLFDIYRTLRASNLSPYMFYFSSDSIEIAGASPETLVKLENSILQTFPLAGTRPRGTSEEEDMALEQELLSDEKELAEHNMLVDLGRNDIGRVSRLGTVQVEKYMSIERFSHVMHIGSAVRGEIREDRDALDAIGAVLPAGTLSGAPKIRACEIIHELEGRRRGVYGGAIGYLDFAGNMDTCIAIRLIYQKNGRICIRSGAGIVADSVPEKEYQECMNKAKAVLNAITEAEGGLV